MLCPDCFLYADYWKKHHKKTSHEGRLFSGALEKPPFAKAQGHGAHSGLCPSPAYPRMPFACSQTSTCGSSRSLTLKHHKKTSHEGRSFYGALEKTRTSTT